MTNPTSEAVEAASDFHRSFSTVMCNKHPLFVASCVDEAIEAVQYLKAMEAESRALRSALTTAEERARKAEAALRDIAQKRPGQWRQIAERMERIANEALCDIEEAAARDAVEEGR